MNGEVLNIWGTELLSSWILQGKFVLVNIFCKLLESVYVINLACAVQYIV